MTTTALILAGGDNRRWIESGGRGRKELVKVWDEPLLCRTLSQMSRHCSEVVVVADSQEIWDAVADFRSIHRAAPDTSKLGSLLGSHWLEWADRTAVILADVVMDDDLAARITSPTKPVDVWGTFFSAEIYAISWRKPFKIESHIRHAIAHGPNLWNLYRSVIGVDQNKHMCDASLWNEVERNLVCDFDYPDQYRDWLQRIPQCLQ